jgi:hypothetical protein
MLASDGKRKPCEKGDAQWNSRLLRRITQRAALIKYLAIIAAWVDDKDLACEELATAIRYPGCLSYGHLKLLPFWDPLRGDPRFEKILVSLTPKQ